MNICKRQFRIVTDQFLGYEVQVKFWYWPFWQEVGFANTHTSIKCADKFIKKTKLKWDFKQKVVKELNCG